MKEKPDRDSYGEYDVESFLGKGSIGRVWLAKHRRMGRRVALKTVQLEQKFEDDEDRIEFFRRLQREAELCGAMQHPNIVTLYDVGYEGDVVSYLATEYIDGDSLLARLRRTRPLPLGEAMSIAADILRGLAYAHSKGIIHRDIKPANILMTAEGQAKVADFGVARPLHSSLTATRSLVGTPNYMSPEQVRSTPVSPRSDLFSAGVVMYEMLTGVKPFSSPELSGILYNVVNHDPARVNEVNPVIPEAISRIVGRLLEKNPEDRYSSAAEALADAEDALREPETSAAVTFETLGLTPHEVTSPLPTLTERDRRALLRRPVAPVLFWMVTLVLVGSLVASLTTLRRAIQDQKPTGLVTPGLAQINQAKIRELETARAHTAAGRYTESLALYDAFIARHPQSLAARQEREETARLLEAATPKAELTKTGRRPRSEPALDAPAAPKPEEPKDSRWDRFKRWWRAPPKNP